MARKDKRLKLNPLLHPECTKEERQEKLRQLENQAHGILQQLKFEGRGIKLCAWLKDEKNRFKFIRMLEKLVEIPLPYKNRKGKSIIIQDYKLYLNFPAISQLAGAVLLGFKYPPEKGYRVRKRGEDGEEYPIYPSKTKKDYGEERRSDPRK